MKLNYFKRFVKCSKRMKFVLPYLDVNFGNVFGENSLKNFNYKLSLKLFKRLISLILLNLSFFILSNYPQKAKLVVQTGHTSPITSVIFSPDGKFVISASLDNTVIIWDILSKKELKTYNVGFQILSIDISPDSKTLAIGGNDKTIKLWNIENEKEISLIGHAGYVHSLVFSPDGKSLVSGATDHGVLLWDIETGKRLKTLVDTDIVNTVAFSPDGKTIASGGYGQTIKLWDTSDGKLLKTFLGHSSVINSVVFSPDGQIIASSSYDSTVRLWNINTKQEFKTFSDGAKFSLFGVKFSPDGTMLAFISDNKELNGEENAIKIFSISTGQQLRTFLNKSSSFSFSPNSKEVVGASNDINIWDISKGQKLINFSPKTYFNDAAMFSQDNSKITTITWGNNVKLWLLNENKVLRTLFGHTDSLRDVAFSSDGKTLASASYDKTIRLWDILSGKQLKLLADTNWAFNLMFSPDGKLLVSKNRDNILRLWDVATGKELRSFKDRYPIGFSPDNKILFSLEHNDVSLYKSDIYLYDLTTKKEKATLKGDFSIVWTSIAFSPDGNILATQERGGILKLWNLTTLKEITTLNQNSDYPIEKVSFSESGKVLVSESFDKTIKFWDIGTGKELRSFRLDKSTIKDVLDITPNFYGQNISNNHLFGVQTDKDGSLNIYDVKTSNLLVSLIAIDENDWVVTTPDGLFDASPNARKLMHYVIGLEPITLDQMKDIYYVPGLLQKIFKGDPLPKVALFEKKDLFPDVEFSQTESDQNNLKIKLTNRGGGIGQVQVLVNGKEVIRDARPVNFDVNTKEAELVVDLNDAPFIPGQENKIEVIARNSSGSLSNRGTSRGTELAVSKGNSKKVTPNIYVIASGISNYTSDNLKLNYAAMDAEDFAKTIELGAVKLLGDKNKVHIRLLTSNGDKSTTKFDVPDAKVLSATKKDVEMAFADFKNATTNDVFIVYLAGHGVSLNLNQNPTQAGGDTYLYLTQEAYTTDKTLLAIENTRHATTVSSDELKDLMKQNKALKQVLILDTCAAGALSNSLVAKRADIPGSQIKAMETLKDNTGFYVLMGSSADAVSYEANQYGQGLLTYSLLEAMKGAKLRDGSFAFVADLFGYAQEKVPEMAKNIGGIQRPITITPDVSGNFPIGQFTVEEQKQINLSNPKPVFLRPNLRNSVKRFDDLRLSQMMTEKLRQASYAQSRGESCKIVFVDADEMTDAIQPVGDYTMEGDNLKISVILVKNNKPIGKEITLTGQAREIEKVIEQLIKALTSVPQ